MPERWYAAPTFYFGNAYAVYGPHMDVPMLPGSDMFDFELEVAAVMGQEGRDLIPEQARDHIVGCTILDDGVVTLSGPRGPDGVPGRGRLECHPGAGCCGRAGDFGDVVPQAQVGGGAFGSPMVLIVRNRVAASAEFGWESGSASGALTRCPDVPRTLW